jgi:hypothetical protein
MPGCRLRRFIRGVRPDRNPLRRPVDRAETWLVAGLLAAAVAGAPFAAPAVGHAAYEAAQQIRQQELAARYPVTAVLTADAGQADNYPVTALVPVKVTWTAPGGGRESGEVPVPAGARRGTGVPLWTDARGDLVNPPLAQGELTVEANAATAGTLGALAVAWLVAVAATRRLLNRRRLAGWEAGWRVTEPEWNRQRW